MTRRSVRALLLSGVAVALLGIAAAQGGSGKSQDRLPSIHLAENRTPAGPMPPETPETAEDAAPCTLPFAAGDSPARSQAPMERARRAPPPAPPMGLGGPRFHRPDLAQALAGAETAIGIRTDQLDAWRDFTDALQAALPPPFSGADPRGRRRAQADRPQDPPSPFAAMNAWANRLQDQGRAGERLARAITALEARLSPEQLARAARLGPAMRPPRRSRPPWTEEG